jgi:hypothetical protein
VTVPDPGGASIKPRDLGPPSAQVGTRRWDVATAVIRALRSVAGGRLAERAGADIAERQLRDRCRLMFEKERRMTSELLSAQTVLISGTGGDQIQAYLARPGGDGSRGGWS